MLKSLLAKISPKIKTRRRSPVDCSDFVAAVPFAPPHSKIREVVTDRLFNGKPPAGSKAEEEQRDCVIRATTFDLQYRCGGGGRCVVPAGTDGKEVPPCRFPCCFNMRPITKGAEILAERFAYEVDGVPDPQVAKLIALARQDKLDECQKGIQACVMAKLREAAGGKQLASAFVSPEERESVAVNQQTGADAPLNGCNPLVDNEALRDEVVSLYLWRAALLVNLRRDEQAVGSLLNLAFSLKNEHRLRAFVGASQWATLNDMEIIYYRSFIQNCDPTDVAQLFAQNRPTLLKRVFEACKGDTFFVQHAAHMAFSKEITALVSRAQSAQQHGDLTEDPMTSYCVPFALQYYRFFVSPEFWDHVFNLMIMPPSEASATERPSDPMREMNLTPPHILDAVGRSILLHHLMKLHESREKAASASPSSDSTNDPEVDSVRRTLEEQSKTDPFLTPHQTSLAMLRLRELLSVVKDNERFTLQQQQRAQSNLAQPTPPQPGAPEGSER